MKLRTSYPEPCKTWARVVARVVSVEACAIDGEAFRRFTAGDIKTQSLRIYSGTYIWNFSYAIAYCCQQLSVGILSRLGRVQLCSGFQGQEKQLQPSSRKEELHPHFRPQSGCLIKTFTWARFSRILIIRAITRLERAGLQRAVHAALDFQSGFWISRCESRRDESLNAGAISNTASSDRTYECF